MNELMEKFLKDDLGKMIPRAGQIIKGGVLFKRGPAVYVDIGPYQTGVIYGAEYYEAREILKNHKLGDELIVKVKEAENDEGLVELSLKEAGEETLFAGLKEKMKNRENVIVKIKGANKGGLISEIEGLPAFLPASQLSSENYPKIDEASPAKIAQELTKFVGTEMTIRIIAVDENEKKAVFSQKEIERELVEENLKDYKVGDKISGEVSGLTNFGVFVKFKIKDKNYDYEGLISLAETINGESLKVGDKIETKIINKEGSRIYLSMKP